MEFLKLVENNILWIVFCILFAFSGFCIGTATSVENLEEIEKSCPSTEILSEYQASYEAAKEESVRYWKAKNNMEKSLEKCLSDYRKLKNSK